VHNLSNIIAAINEKQKTN